MNASSKEILIVGRDAVFGPGLAAALSRLGLAAVFTADAQAALAQLDSLRPDLILLGRDLGGMSGPEVCRRLKSTPGRANIRTAPMAAPGHPASVILALESGADFVFSETSDASTLAGDIRDYLNRDLTVEAGQGWLRQPEVAAVVLRRMYEKVAAETADRPTAPESARPVSGLRVLLAEDNMVNRILAERLLGRLGCAVTTADTGLKVLEALRLGTYDLVLMDIMMPVMNGLEASRRIRADRSRTFDPDIPIVALTAQTYALDREQCLAAGMTDFLEKPLDNAKLERILRLAARKTTSAAPAVPPTPAPADSDSRSGPAVPDPDDNSDASILDVDTLKTRYQNNMDLLREIYQIYRNDSFLRMTRMREAVGLRDMSRLAREAHSMNGASSAIGAGRVAVLAQSLEAAARKNDLDAALRLCDQLEVELAKVRALIN